MKKRNMFLKAFVVVGYLLAAANVAKAAQTNDESICDKPAASVLPPKNVFRPCVGIGCLPDWHLYADELMRRERVIFPGAPGASCVFMDGCGHKLH